MKKLMGVAVLLLLFFATPTTAIFLDDLEDVTISSVQDNQHLIYDSASSNWTNEVFVDTDTTIPNKYEHDQQLNRTNVHYMTGLNVNKQSGDVGYFYNASGNAQVWLSSGTNSGLIKLNGASGKAGGFYILSNMVYVGGLTYGVANNVLKFAVYNSGWAYPLQMSKLSSTNSIFIDQGWMSFFKDSHSTGKEVDVNGDHQAVSYNPTSDKRAKNIKFNLNDISDIKILELCSIMDIYVFEWKDPQIKNMSWNSEGYGISVIAQELFWNLKNFTNNQNLNDKLAHGLVTVGDEKNLWSINKDNFIMIYARAVQILIDEVFGGVY